MLHIYTDHVNVKTPRDPHRSPSGWLLHEIFIHWYHQGWRGWIKSSWLHIHDKSFPSCIWLPTEFLSLSTICRPSYNLYHGSNSYPTPETCLFQVIFLPITVYHNSIDQCRVISLTLQSLHAAMIDREFDDLSSDWQGSPMGYQTFAIKLRWHQIFRRPHVTVYQAFP